MEKIKAWIRYILIGGIFALIYTFLGYVIVSIFGYLFYLNDEKIKVNNAGLNWLFWLFLNDEETYGEDSEPNFNNGKTNYWAWLRWFYRNPMWNLKTKVVGISNDQEYDSHKGLIIIGENKTEVDAKKTYGSASIKYKVDGKCVNSGDVISIECSRLGKRIIWRRKKGTKTMYFEFGYASVKGVWFFWKWRIREIQLGANWKTEEDYKNGKFPHYKFHLKISKQ